MLLIRAIYVLTFASVLCLLSDKAIAEESPRDRFLARYEPSADALIGQYTKKCRFRAKEIVFADDRQIASSFEHEYLASDSCIIVKHRAGTRSQSGAPPGSSKNKWAILRPDGIFQVEEAERGGEFVLTGAFPANKASAVPDWPFSLAFLPVVLHKKGIVEYVKHPQVVTQSLEQTTWRGSTAMVLRVTDSLGGNWHRTLYFDPNRNWLLLEVVSVRPGDGSSRGVIRYHYGNQADDIFPLSKVEAFVENNDSSVSRRWVIEYSDFSRAEPSDEEFSLARFGLPDSWWTVSRVGQNWFMWLGLGGAALLLISVGIYWVRRRYILVRK